MSKTAERDVNTLPSTDDGASGQATDAKWPVAEFHPGLGDHPLWQDLMDEIAKNRQADIAEANRLADLEERAGGADGSPTSADAGWPVPEFKHNLGDNPLWDEFMEEMKKNRQADIVEANRLADLELEQQG